MLAVFRAVVLLVLLVPLVIFAVDADAAAPGAKPAAEHNYVCPHADGKPQLECYLDAVPHLYTMCRNVKSIEIIEFGYENSREGVNAAKSESCLDKQKQNIARPFQAALREAARSKQAIEELHRLQDAWLAAMTGLAWQAGESDGDYKARVGRPYDEFNRRIEIIRAGAAEVESPAAAKSSPGKRAPAAKSKTAPKAKKH